VSISSNFLLNLGNSGNVGHHLGRGNRRE